MSTKFTVKSQHRDGDEPGFHLYHDVLEEMACEADGSEPPLYLRLEGVEVELQTVREGGVTVGQDSPRDRQGAGARARTIRAVKGNTGSGHV